MPIFVNVIYYLKLFIVLCAQSKNVYLGITYMQTERGCNFGKFLMGNASRLI